MIPLSGRVLSALSAVAALFLPVADAAAGEPALSGATLEKAFKPGPGEFSVMTYNLYRFQYDDRDRDGQENDFKPDSEIRAQMAVIAAVSPDVIACMEMGTGPAFQKFREALKGAGLDYPHAEHVVQADSHTHLALVSRLPIVARMPITNEVYSIGTNTVPVQRGFLCVDIKVNDGYTFRLMAAHLKSKRFSAMGQTEMRRNEGRLLNKNARHFLADDTNLNLIVVGDFNDTQDSAAIREVIGKPPVLKDLRPADAFGDTWTHIFYPEDSYSRIDYMLCSPGMFREVVTGKCHVVRHEMTRTASDHRPVVSVFRAQNL